MEGCPELLTGLEAQAEDVRHPVQRLFLPLRQERRQHVVEPVQGEVPPTEEEDEASPEV